jgi:hypothetical protein
MYELNLQQFSFVVVKRVVIGRSSMARAEEALAYVCHRSLPGRAVVGKV